MQVVPDPHEVQVTPLSPHETFDCALVGWQVPDEQQPSQLKKSQATFGVQAPLVHAWFIGHKPQPLPEAPHCVGDWLPYGTQRLPWQHPAGHVVGLHVATEVHWPLAQVPDEQAAQLAAPRPQALLF